MAKVKIATLFFFFITLFLLCSTLAYAARPEPTLSKNQVQAVGTAEQVEEVSCDGVGEDECLMRRTLAAHVDYIYTQKHKP